MGPASASRVQGRPAAAAWGRVQIVSTTRTRRVRNAKGSWNGWEVTVHGLVEHKAHYTQAKAFADSANKGEVTVKYEAEGATEGETSGPVPF